jgi:hypothetical protein
MSGSDYGSEGWGFESLRARKIKGQLSCINGNQAPLVVCPGWTTGAPRVLVCFAAVYADPGSGVLEGASRPDL